VLSTLAAFAENYPRSAAPKRLSLEIVQGEPSHWIFAFSSSQQIGETFRELARSYLVSGLEKGLPSLFVDVKGVYVDSEKMKIVGEIVENLIVQLEADSGLHEDGERVLCIIFLGLR
jgi:hypothetical protein